jgi:hypothetical protein
MEENLLALFEKSRMFSPYGHGPRAKVKIEGMKDYKFFTCNCFYERSSDGLRMFKGSIKSLLRRYINVWAKILDEDPVSEFDWKEHSKKTFSFCENFEWEKILNKIESGRKCDDLNINANGSRIRIKRFGDILAFNVLNQNNEKKEHLTGIRAIKALCRKEDSGNNQGVYEIIHKAKVQISILGNNPYSRKYVFDFDKTYKQLKIALPWINWNFDTFQLIDTYLSKESLIIGQYCGLQIFAELIHEDNNQASSSSQKGLIWRRGNVEDVNGSVYTFANGNDIRLKLELRSSLPDTIFEDIETSAEFHSEQFIIAEAAAIFCTQLCSMQLNRYRESRASIGD